MLRFTARRGAVPRYQQAKQSNANNNVIDASARFAARRNANNNVISLADRRAA